MKCCYKLFFTLVLLLIKSSVLMAQKEPTPVTRNNPYKKMIHFNPLPLVVSGFEMGYEKALKPKETFYTQLGFYTSEEAGALKVFNTDYNTDYKDMNGLRLELQYRFYRKTNNYIKNVFIAPFLNFKTISATHIEERSISSGPPNYTYKTETITTKQAASTVAFGYMMGYRKSVFENIYMDMSFGGGVYLPVAGSYHKELNVPFFSPYRRGVMLRANLGFCIAL